MTSKKVYRAIGLMSGTALDGAIDVALIETDGHDFVRALRYMAYPYDIEVRDKVRACFGKKFRDEQVDEAEKLVTNIHIAAIKEFDEKADIIGFHGQTITHDPNSGFTWQIGDGQVLARATGIDVVCDMRQSDIKAGGQGAPLLPLYHKALINKRNVAALNLGGVANITYISSDDDLIAFDCGTANALMDDFIKLRVGLEFDENGAVASHGTINQKIVTKFCSHEYFTKPPPKSLDRDNWSIDLVKDLSTEDGMVTLLDMSIQGVVKSMEYLPQKPKHIYVCGGGRKNIYFLSCLVENLEIPVTPIDDLGFDGDAIEAQGFAYLAVRSLLGLPITLPSTTGVPEPLTGGLLFKP